MLLDNAREKGALAKEETTVFELLKESGRVVGVRAQTAGEKVQEEAEEVARAAREESDERVAEEAADVLYHLLVLLRKRGLSLADAGQVLDGRSR